MKRPEAGDLKIQPDRADVEGRRDLIVDDVVKLELARVSVAQHHVGRAVAVEVAEARDLKIQPDRAQVRRRRDGVVATVVKLELARGAAAQDHVRLRRRG